MPSAHLVAVGTLPTPKRMGQLYDALNSAFEIVVPPSVVSGANGCLLKSSMLTAIAAWVAARTALTLMLSTVSFVANGDTVIGALTAPTGSWYAAATVTLGTAYLSQDDGLWHIPIASHEWVYSGTDASVQIYGWGLIDTF